MAVLSDFLTILKRKVRDTPARFGDTSKNAIIGEAVRQFSRDKPLIVDSKLVGDGTRQVFTSPTDWVDGTSYVLRFEHPVDETPVSFRDVQDNIEIVQRANVEQIATKAFTLQSLEEARLFYAIPYTVDGAGSNVRAQDEEMVLNLAAHRLCIEIAAFYNDNQDNSLAASTVNHQQVAENFKSLATSFLAAYKDAVEAGDIVTPAVAFAEQDVMLSWGSDLLTHPKRFR